MAPPLTFKALKAEPLSFQLPALAFSDKTKTRGPAGTLARGCLRPPPYCMQRLVALIGKDTCNKMRVSCAAGVSAVEAGQAGRPLV